MNDSELHTTAQTDVSLADLFGSLYRAKWLILALVTVFTILGVVYMFLATPIYRAQVVVVPVGDDAESQGLSPLLSQFGGIAGLPAGLGRDSGVGLKNEALATLESRSFLTDFIRSYELLPILFAKKWDADNDQWLPEYADDPPTYAKAQRKFKRQIMNVREDRETGVISISLDWHDREQAAQWANDIVRILNNQLRTSSLKASEKKIAYLNQELAKTSVAGIQQGVYRLLEAEMSKMSIANTRSDFAFKVIDPAVVPDQDDKVSPRAPLVLAGAVFLGLLAGIGWTVLRLIARKVR